MIIIRYASPPDLIVFSIGDVTYILEHCEKTPRTPYTITEVGGFKTRTNNINEWLGLKTRARYNLELLHDLANAFLMGRDSAYSQEDLEVCADKVFEHVCSVLFRDGLAGRFAEFHDIECMSLNTIRRKLNDAATVKVPQERVRRYIHVCRKNGWIDLASSWERYLEDGSETPPDLVQDPVAGEVIRRGVNRLVRGLFTKDKDYKDIITTIQRQHPLQET